MPTRISKLTLTGFRGATKPATIEFDVTKPVALIFGENGTGKSTIADAFDFICNRSFGSLENYSLGEPAKNHIASLGCRAADVRVTLDAVGKTWQATMGKSGPTATPAVGLPDARILRRRTILSLIEVQPSKRFETLKAFIAVPNIDKCEAALRDACNSTNAAANDAVRAIAQAEEDLTRLWIAEGKPGTTALGWATAEAAKDLSALWASVALLDNLVQGYGGAEKALDSLDAALAELQVAEQKLAAARREQQQSESRSIERNGALLNLLLEAESYVAAKNELARCPVCEQTANRQTLARRLSERIAEMQDLAETNSATARAGLEYDRRAAAVEDARQAFCQEVRQLAGSLREGSLSEVAKLKLDSQHFQRLLEEGQRLSLVEPQAREFWAALAPIRAALEVRRDADRTSINQHNALKGYTDTLREKRQSAQARGKLLLDLNAALEIVMRERKDYIEGILGAISAEVQALYQKLHPDERIGQVKFFLKPNTIGSLEFDAQFQDRTKLPPQAYYSESHLDTLGICVFLALSKHFKTDNTIVILDDVLTSVDGPHLDRFMALLHEEARHYAQVIITTHYRPWRDRYRWAKGSMASTQVIELGPWSLENGLQTGEFLTAVDELDQAMKSARFDLW